MTEPSHDVTTVDYRALEERHATGVYSKRQLTIVRGAGATLWDDTGRAFIDCASGQGVANLGHCHPRVVRAIQTQAATLITCQEALHNDQRALLSTELAAALPAGMERIFLCNSGAEAVEAALKFARASSGRPGVVAAMRGFHGRTFGALSATWEAHYRAPFEPLLPGFSHIPYNNLQALEAAVNEQTAAVLLEVVQGESGVRPATGEFLRCAQELCRARGALLLLDEVQTGFGRTGRMWALEHHALEPDVLILAKSIAGGVPMGAVAVGSRVSLPGPGTHGSTFGGNPLACAAARATLAAILDEQLPQQAAAKGAWLLDRLGTLESRRVRELRGLGLMIGIELRERVAPVLQSLQQRGIIALPGGPSVLRLLPPLVIEQAQLEQVADTLAEVLA